MKADPGAFPQSSGCWNAPWHANGSEGDSVNVPAFSLHKTLRFLAVWILLLPLGARAQDQDQVGAGNTFARKVLSEVNFARTEPVRYAAFLASCRPHYRGNMLTLPGEPLTRSHEGVAALEEAVQALCHTRPLPPLTLSGGLGRAAADLAREQAQTGALGHRGTDGSSPFARMSRHGRWHTHAGEAIDYGGATARRVVYNLIVDDGVRDRGHRLNLLAPDFHVVGVAQASHPQFRRVCVIDFAADYTEAGALPAPGSDTVAMVAPDGTRWTRRPAVGVVPSALGSWRR